MYNTTDPAARLSVYAPAIGRINLTSKPEFSDFSHPLGSEKSVVGENTSRDLSDSVIRLLARLEFSFFGVAKQHQGGLLLPDYIAADSFSGGSHLPNNTAANRATASVCPEYSSPHAIRVAKETRVFSDPAFPSGLHPQQTPAARDVASVADQQQLFSFTPSELVFPASSTSFLINPSC